jgi:hypothetical protein
MNYTSFWIYFYIKNHGGNQITSWVAASWLRCNNLEHFVASCPSSSLLHWFTSASWVSLLLVTCTTKLYMYICDDQ